MPAVRALRALGHDVLALVDGELAEQAISDAEVLAVSGQKRRALLTLNRRHFIRLHGEFPEHAGIIVCTFDANFVALADRIHGALEERVAIYGQLVRINRPSY